MSHSHKHYWLLFSHKITSETCGKNSGSFLLLLIQCDLREEPEGGFMAQKINFKGNYSILVGLKKPEHPNSQE